jgi:hypothetical protein
MGADPLGATTGESTFSIANTFGGAKAGEANKVGEAAGGVNTTGYESGLSGEDYYGDLSKLSRPNKV